MSSPALSNALQFVLRWEGGFVDDPVDPGGRTNQGVTQVVYDTWRKRQGFQDSKDVKQISAEEVHAIYENDYWRPPGCNVLEGPLDLVQFDTAVNMGVGRAVRFLQSAVGCKEDGSFGPNTREHVSGCKDIGKLINDYCDARQAFYERLVEKKPELKKFLKGWLNRLNSLRHEIGLPGFESAPPLDFGDAPYIKRIPPGAAFDV